MSAKIEHYVRQKSRDRSDIHYRRYAIGCQRAKSFFLLSTIGFQHNLKIKLRKSIVHLGFSVSTMDLNRGQVQYIAHFSWHLLIDVQFCCCHLSTGVARCRVRPLATSRGKVSSVQRYRNRGYGGLVCAGGGCRDAGLAAGAHPWPTWSRRGCTRGNCSPGQ